MSRRVRRIAVLVVIGCCLLTYFGGYARLRLRHYFVRDATYYTRAGRTVHTDRIRPGEGSWFYPHPFPDKIYKPLLWLEAMFWRWYEAMRDGGRVSWQSPFSDPHIDPSDDP